MQKSFLKHLISIWLAIKPLCVQHEDQKRHTLLTFSHLKQAKGPIESHKLRPDFSMPSVPSAYLRKVQNPSAQSTDFTRGFRGHQCLTMMQ